MAGAGAAIFAQINKSDRAREAFAVTLQNAADRMGAGSSAAAGAAMHAAREEGDADTED